MAKGAKLTILKSVLKKVQSFKLRSPGSTANDLHPVYVGKSRRRYLISSDILDNPLFRELVSADDENSITVVGCEVVLFDHLLWMIENTDPPSESSLDELVEFYTC